MCADITKVDLIAAARPNFMKVAPLYRLLSSQPEWCQVRFVHTGQHYDASMSTTFLHDLGLPQPQLSLGIGSGTHAEQTGGVMIAYERACREDRPDWTIVVGDVNSTAACALAAAKIGVRVAHLEAGLRSRDRTMPEEINRIVTDAIADVLWTPSPDADENLLREGIPPEKIERVGNIMIDSLELMRPRIDSRRFYTSLDLQPGQYGVVTLHRPVNVDNVEALTSTVCALARIAEQLPLIFPVHPRTRKMIEAAGLSNELQQPRLRLIEPVGYIDFMSLIFSAKLVITDSGGIQEETTYLRIPCLTLRESTERPVTVTLGTNRLVSIDLLPTAFTELMKARTVKGRIPELWDGNAAARIASSLRKRSGTHIQA